MPTPEEGGTARPHPGGEPSSGEGGGRRDGEEPRGTPYLPGWIPWAVYAAVTLFLFREFVVSDAMLYGSDTLSLGYVARDFFARALEGGVFPLWNPIILGGTPFLESLAGGDSLYPPSLALLVLLDTHRALGWKLVVHVFLAGLFTYGWIRTLGGSRAAGLLAGLAYLLAPFLVSLVYPGHDGKIFVTALTPLLFWSVERSFRAADLLPWIGTAVVVALVILTTHFQMAYFLFGAVGLYAIARTVVVWRRGSGAGKEAGKGGSGSRRWGWDAGTGSAGDDDAPRGRRPALRKLGLFIAASLLGGAVSAVQLVPAVSYVTEHSRRTATTVQADEAGSVEYASSWSLHPEEIASLVVPEFVGNDAGEEGWAAGTYWGRNPFKLNHEYAGLVVLLLAGLGLLAGRGPFRWFMAGLGSLALLYALGAHTPVWRVFYEIVPGVRLFRAPSMAIFLFGFAAVTLAARGVDHLLRTGRVDDPAEARRGSRFLWGAAAALALGTLLAASGVLTSAWTAILGPELGRANAQALAAAEPHIVRGFFVATLLALATAGLAWAHREGRLGGAGVVVGLGVLLFVDAVRVDEPFVRTFDVHRWAAPTADVRFLQSRQREEPPFRVLSMEQGGQDVKPGLYGIELAAGHHPNDLARYRELIGMQGSGMPENLLRSTNVLRILNVRYIVWPDAQLGPLEGMERLESVEGPDGRTLRSVYPAPGLPRARLVGRARVVSGPAAVDTILSAGFDPRSEVVLDREPPVRLPGSDVEGSVEWEARGPNRLELRVRNEEPAMLVLAENWYPAWRARVDGRGAPVLRANHALRAVPLEAGEHRVEVYYESSLLRRSFWLSVLTGAALAAVAAMLLVRRRRSGRGT